MAEFRMKIAGQVGTICSLFDSTRDYCRAYLTDERPDFGITVTREDLAFEQAELDAEARQEGFRLRVFTDPFLERAAIQRKFAEHLLGRGVLLFHGSGIAVDGAGYLFTAKSGTGKSTHTRLWRQVFGERAVMINDDKPFLAITGQGVTMYGAPWSGKHGLDANIAIPLRGICILERGSENHIEQIDPSRAMARLLHESFCPLGQEAQVQALVTALAEQVPLWHMECTRDPRAAEIAHEAMAAAT